MLYHVHVRKVCVIRSIVLVTSLANIVLQNANVLTVITDQVMPICDFFVFLIQSVFITIFPLIVFVIRFLRNIQRSNWQP